jgi:tetratricopeptide (TPR) repeat protein
MRYKNKMMLCISLLALAYTFVYSQPLYASSPDHAEIMELYNQAREMFRQANELSSTNPDAANDLYRKSVMRFETIVWKGGIKNGKLFYNIGNIYFKMGDIGRAILNYKRASQFIPNDPNLIQNFKSAKARRADRIEEPQKERVLKTLFFWHYDLSTAPRVFIFIFFFVTLWVVAIIRLFVSRQYLSWLIIVASIISILFFSSLSADFLYQQKYRQGVIISPEVIARKGNSVAYEQSFTEPLHAGTEFILIEERENSWYHIELTDSRRCWIPAEDAEFVILSY